MGVTYCCHKILACASCGRFSGRVKRHHHEKKDDDGEKEDGDGEEGEKGSAADEKNASGSSRRRCCGKRKRHRHDYHARVRVRTKEDDFRLLCSKGQVKQMEKMLEKHLVTDVDAATSGGYTGMHCAAVTGHVAVMAFLVGRKADLNAKTSGGLTPLILASANGQASLVESLLHRHVSIEDKAETRRGNRQAHHFAAGFGNEELGKLIKSHMPKKEGSDAGSRGSRGGRSGSSHGSKGEKSQSSGSQRSGERFQVGGGGTKKRTSAVSAGTISEDGETSD